MGLSLDIVLYVGIELIYDHTTFKAKYKDTIITVEISRKRYIREPDYAHRF